MSDNVGTEEFGPLTAAEEADPSSKAEIESTAIADLSVESQLAHYKRREQELLEQNALNEDNFGLKRAQFMDLFKNTEAELNKQSLINEDLLKKSQEYEKIISKLEQEIEDVKTAASLAETARNSDLEDMTRRHKEEVASIQILMNDTLEQFQRSEEDNDIIELRKRIDDLENENISLKSKVENRDGLLSSVAKTFQKKISLGSSSSEPENLEDSMKKAQENAEILRSIVLPFEEEIESLKKQLSERDKELCRLKEGEIIDGSKTNEGMKLNDSMIDKDTSGEDVDSLKNNLHDISRELNHMQKLHDLSLEEWQLAQQVSSTDIQRIMQFISEEQQIKIEESQKEDKGRESTKNRLNEIREARAKLESEGNSSFLNLSNLDLSTSESTLDTSKNIKDSAEKCAKCGTISQKLEEVKEAEMKANSHVKTLERYLDSERQASARLRSYADELEDNLKVKSMEFDERICALRGDFKKTSDAYKSLRHHFNEMKNRLYLELNKVKDEREQAEIELRKFQAENESLLGKYGAHSAQLAEAEISLPTDPNEIQFYLLQTREELIKAKVAKEHIEEQLNSKILFIKDQIHSEQLERSRVEDALNTELMQVRKKLKEETDSKKQVMDDVSTLRIKVSSLQEDLNNSECVQRDFVKLSQSLQIELERERAKQTEVRWQNEEDIDECNKCKTTFTVTRRKHHCRHCGRIFCADCVSNTVLSGPQRRPAKVCQVCHTMLVPEAKPYFSQDLPEQST
ncbi:DgyrCDS5212 [Dimorphilus gyrociliatus]|uniref:DgyrCDS5212 n=1 Tax=Dimorphilus gyrociliatus TaxID=2664684 RepID=A0A7I8VJ65_9ANNE|nr:DgyrCDS5212 [Dimorphilus gyrociliatus]